MHMAAEIKLDREKAERGGGGDAVERNASENTARKVDVDWFHFSTVAALQSLPCC